MKVNVRGLEVTVDNLDELRQLIDTFGSNQSSDTPKAKTNASTPGNNGSDTGSVVHDRVILEHLVNAGDTGVHTNTLGDMLGKRGKAIGRGLLQWGVKIRLVSDANNNPFERARPNGGRGWKLKPTMLPIAKQMLEDMM